LNGYEKRGNYKLKSQDFDSDAMYIGCNSNLKSEDERAARIA
jgi:hypothetical protein